MNEQSFYKEAHRVNSNKEKRSIFVDTGYERIQIFVKKGQNAEKRIAQFLDKLQRNRKRNKF